MVAYGGPETGDESHEPDAAERDGKEARRWVWATLGCTTGALGCVVAVAVVVWVAVVAVGLFVAVASN
ncbi:hypothetical protein ACFYY9_16785 [Streptomyces nigra]|uniref:hypothetical protein n=1 Tax=Streptomyces nigra TaxID=1827580 RepID=UPI0036353875